ncbi:MAG: FAD-dependent oxidoreductase [Bacteroidota bacterium]|nr:FAD-dependent oxidoreductase [Bacteroidota bacterium]
MKYKYGIIGQGLAGSSLWWHLHKLGQDVVIIDTDNRNCSKTAAGLMNPITGRKMVTTWLADELFTYCHKYYDELELMFDIHFFHKTSILRLANSEDEANFSSKSLTSFDYLNYKIKKLDQPKFQGLRKFDSGFALGCSTWLDTEVYLNGIADYATNLGQYVDCQLDTENIGLKVSGHFQLTDQIECENLILCQGYLAEFNPFFSYLPWATVKGELLTIYAPNLSEEYVFMKGVYAIPVGDSVFKVGSTYDWNDKSKEPTVAKREQILSQLNKLIYCDFKIVNHEAGIRPAVNDRRPFLGAHTELSNLYIFNGFGTKGVTLSPYFAAQMANYLVNDTPLLPAVNINRYQPKM